MAVWYLVQRCYNCKPYGVSRRTRVGLNLGLASVYLFIQLARVNPATSAVFYIYYIYYILYKRLRNEIKKKISYLRIITFSHQWRIQESSRGAKINKIALKFLPPPPPRLQIGPTFNNKVPIFPLSPLFSPYQYAPVSQICVNKFKES